MWRRRNERKIFGGGTVLFLEEKNRKRKKRKILHDGKYLSCEGEKPRRKGRKKNWKQIFFCGGEEKRRVKVEIYLEKENIFLVEEKKNGEGKGGNHNRRQLGE